MIREADIPRTVQVEFADGSTAVVVVSNVDLDSEQLSLRIWLREGAGQRSETRRSGWDQIVSAQVFEGSVETLLTLNERWFARQQQPVAATASRVEVGATYLFGLRDGSQLYGTVEAVRTPGLVPLYLIALADGSTRALSDAVIESCELQ